MRQDFALISSRGRTAPAWKGWGTTAGTLSPKTHLAAQQVAPEQLRQQSSKAAGHWDALLEDKEDQEGQDVMLMLAG